MSYPGTAQCKKSRQRPETKRGKPGNPRCSPLPPQREGLATLMDLCHDSSSPVEAMPLIQGRFRSPRAFRSLCACRRVERKSPPPETQAVHGSTSSPTHGFSGWHCLSGGAVLGKTANPAPSRRPPFTSASVCYARKPGASRARDERELDCRCKAGSPARVNEARGCGSPWRFTTTGGRKLALQWVAATLPPGHR